MHTFKFIFSLAAIVGFVAAAPVAKPDAVATEDPQLYIDVRFLVADEKAKREQAGPGLYTDSRYLVKDNVERKEAPPQIYGGTKNVANEKA
ncbi:hypothetical protein ANO14919_113640 [Xylariales sp. No.14919]|nr:hypothetical protein F5X98DRAFT_377462 [Xylaria grammica]GAW21838.1 hypothetical protein ANO14919_113640 [Xylariales sp. No.14919]